MEAFDVDGNTDIEDSFAHSFGQMRLWEMDSRQINQINPYRFVLIASSLNCSAKPKDER